MQIATLSADSPFFAFVIACMIPAALGIVWLVISKDRRSKRIVLPATLACFSAGVYLVVIGSGQYREQPLILGVIAVALVANAVFVHTLLRFCEDCGVTIPRSGSAPWRCPDCQQRARRTGTR